MTDEELLRKVERLGAIALDAELVHQCGDCDLEFKVRPTREAVALARELREEARVRLRLRDLAAVDEPADSHFPWLEVR